MAGSPPAASVGSSAAQPPRAHGQACSPTGSGPYVVERLQAAWSPEQIAGRLQIEPEGSGSVTHETIYAVVYSPRGKALGLFRHLPMACHRRRTRYTCKPRGLTIPLENTIKRRSPEIAARTSFGHWEGDLVMFRRGLGQHNLTSLVERQSRYTILTRNLDRNATGVVAGVISKLKALPASARRSMTFDRGTEFARYGAAQEQARDGQPFLQATGAVAERLDREHQWPGSARPSKLFLFVPCPMLA